MSILLSNLLASSYQGDKGQKGEVGDKGNDGSFGGASFEYTYDNSTSNTAPASGYLAFNDTDLSTATALLINHTDGNSEDISSFLHTIDDSTSAIKGHFTVTEIANVANFAIFSITGSLVEETAYDYLPIAYLSGSTSITDETPVTITLARTGDVGDKGQKGEVGEKGDTGDKGNQGDVGQKGEIGTTGDKGDTGSKGDKGDTGATGDKGDTGAKGDTGSAGVKGDTGSKGETGATGDKGTKGDTGEKGDTGTTGDKGDAGDKGDTGAKGEKGDTGATGDKGDTGDKGQKGQDGILGDYLYKTSTYTAAAKDIILADTSGGSFTITLPATPSAGEWVRISDGDNWGNNNLTVARNGQTIEGVSDDIVLDIGNLVAEFSFTGTTWLVTTTLGTKGDKGESGGIDLSAVTNTAILFADSGTANGSAAFTFDKASNTVTISGTLVPGANVTYDLGTPNLAFKDLYLSGNTLNLDGVTLSASNGALVLPENTKVGDVTITSPKIANVQVANSSWSALDDTAVDTAGGYILINGSGFQSGCNVLLGSQAAPSVTVANSSQLRVAVPAIASGSYTIYVTNPDGGVAIGLNGLATSNTPVWSTGATLTGASAPATIAVSLAAAEDSDTITYSNVGSLPTGLSLASNGYLTGTLNPESDTTYNFTVRATDEENQDADRTFSITITTVSFFKGQYNSGTVDTETYSSFHNIALKRGANKIYSFGLVKYWQYTQARSVMALNALDLQGNLVWSTTRYQGDLGVGYLRTANSRYEPASAAGLSLYAQTLDVDGSDNAYIAFAQGYNSGSTDHAVHVEKFNSSGERQWSLRVANSTNNSFTLHIPTSLKLDQNGDPVVIMHRGTQSAFQYNANTILNMPSYAFRANGSTGEIMSAWNYQYNHAISLTFDSNNNFITCGGHYGDDAAFGKTYANGTAEWHFKHIGTDRFFNTIAVDSSDDVYAVGVQNAFNQDEFFAVSRYSNGSVKWQKAMANVYYITANSGFIPSKAVVDGDLLYVGGSMYAMNGTSFDEQGFILALHTSNGYCSWARRVLVGSAGTTLTGFDVSGNNLTFSVQYETYNTNDVLAVTTRMFNIPADNSATNAIFGLPGSLTYFDDITDSVRSAMYNIDLTVQACTYGGTYLSTTVIGANSSISAALNVDGSVLEGQLAFAVVNTATTNVQSFSV